MVMLGQGIVKTRCGLLSLSSVRLSKVKVFPKLDCPDKALTPFSGTAYGIKARCFTDLRRDSLGSFGRGVRVRVLLIRVFHELSIWMNCLMYYVQKNRIREEGRSCLVGDQE